MSTSVRRPAVPVTAAVLLWISAVGVIVAGFLHARLFWRGYEQVFLVGPLFILNAIASLVVVLVLISGRPALFALGSLLISVGSLVSIWISHTSSFFGFSEGNLVPVALAIVVAEAVATVAALLGLVALRGRTRAPARAEAAA